MKASADRFKNPYFWLGLIGVVFSAAGISVDSLTSWDLLLNDILAILSNPFLLMSVTAALTGVFVDPTTSGFCDKHEIEEKESQE